MALSSFAVGSRAILLALSLATLPAGCSRNAGEKQVREPQPSAAAPAAAPLPVTAIAEDWAALLSRGTQADFNPPAAALNEGEALSKIHCAACHVRPDPAVFSKRAWAEVFSGLIPIFTSYHILEDPEAIRLPATTRGIFAPPWKAQREYRMKNAEFFKAAAYYLHAAPTESLPVLNRPAFSEGPLPFRIKAQGAAPARGPQPEYTLAVIDESRGRLLLGDKGFLRVFDKSGRLLKALPIPGVPTSLAFEPDGVYVTIIGRDYITTPEALGQLIRFPTSILEPGGRQAYASVLTGLLRPVHARFADFDHDGVKEILLDEFGQDDGALGWYRQKPGAPGRYEHHVLIEGTGAINSAVIDLNGDGFLDVLAMFAQSDESVYRALNDGKGGFTVERIARQQPAFGYNSMAVADMNGDGRPDVVTANGDTLPSMPLKNYHGIRVLADDGHGKYEESYFYPFPGALIVKDGDLDSDGDQDLVATSFFTESPERLQEAVVMLENVGGMKFVPHHLPGGAKGVWVDVGIGDVDGDGDQDLLLGASYPIYAQPLWSAAFPEGRTAFELLENTAPESPRR